jgi:type IV pilus assembly protein PilV
MTYRRPRSEALPNRRVVHAGSSARLFQKGFTLLEVLIAVVVLSIGLLGLASLQVTNMQMNQQSLMRSQEAHLAYDMVDRMRVNMPGVNAGAYDLPTLPTASDTNCTTTTGCTPAAMAAQDYFEWNSAVTAMLPGGDGIVCLDSTPQDGTDSANPACDNTGNMFAVKLWWDHDRDTATAPQRYVLSILL